MDAALKLAPGTRCALEHGGAAPVIVAGDADLDEVLPSRVKGGFYHAGQVCVSVQRVDWMPFTGVKQSGLAVGGIPFTMDDMQIDKMTVWRSKEL